MERGRETRRRNLRPSGVAISIAFFLVLSFGVSHALAQGQGQLVPPHSDSGVDTDGDTLFNFLRLDVSVNATIPGTFYLSAQLYDAVNITFITSASKRFFLSGPAIITLDLYGPDIRSSGVDGPYSAQLSLLDDSFNLDDSGTHTTFAYLSTDFDLVPALFEPPYSDKGLNTDADPLFEFLEIGTRVNVSQPGTYVVSGGLFNASFAILDSNSTTVTLSPGIQIVPIDFVGWTIRASGSDGPYMVSLELYENSTILDSDTYLTSAAYMSTDFEVPPASLAPPHSDHGVDSDGDGLFNSIAVDVSVSVAQAGTYLVSAGLFKPPSTSLGTTGATVSLDIGSNTVQLEFATLPAVIANVDGPYSVSISLYTGQFDFLGRGTHLTSAYTLSQFDPIPARLKPPHSDMGIDRDTPPDGEYNVLEVDVGVNVTASGFFQVNANLLNGGASVYIASDTWSGSLAPGNHTVPLIFPGVTIRSSRLDGPYYVNLTLLVFQGTGRIVVLDGGSHLTNAYNATDFDAVTPANLAGTVRDANTSAGIPSSTVTAYDYLDSYTATTFANSSGQYILNLWEGDWVVTYDDFSHQSDLRRISLSGPTVLDADLAAQGVEVYSEGLTFTTWDSADIRVHSLFNVDPLTFRITFDWFIGNQDQFLAQDEFDAFVGAFGSTPALPTSSEDRFQVDGTPFDLVPGSQIFSFINLTGPIDSPIPPEYDLRGSYVSNTTIPQGGAHTVDVQTDYDTPSATNVYVIHMPSPFVLMTANHSSLVNVTGFGTDTAIVDPSLDPNPFDFVTSEPASLGAGSTDTTRPTVTGGTASPNPAEAGQSILFQATVTDDVQVDSVSVDVSNAAGTSLGNFTMTYNPATGAYETSHTFNLVGTLTFDIWARDSSGNVASASGSVVVRDTTAPTITGTTDTPDPIERGTTVAISTQVSDLIGVGSVNVVIRDPTGAIVGNFPMSHGSGTTYSYSFAPNEVGTFTYAITATDSSGNSALASGSITVVASTGSVSGSVVGPAGEAISGATVRLLSGTTEVSSTTTDANGHFTFAGVGPGSYTVRVEAAGFEAKTASVSVTAGDVAPVSLALVALAAGGPLGFGIQVWAILIGVIVVVAAALVWVMRRRPKAPAR